MLRQPRLLSMTLLTWALFLRVLVPTGWMPAAQGGAFAIQPCPATAPAPVMHEMKDHGGAHHGPSHQSQHSGDCSFSPMQASAVPIDHVPLIPASLLAAEPSTNDAASPLFATGPPAPPPPARGPPAAS
jgi:hypothetical protein